MEDHDYRIMTMGDTTMKCFRDGRVHTLSKKCKKYEKWNITRPNNIDGYLQLRIDNKMIYVHRIIMMCYLGKSDKQVDHINSIRNDNRLENLQYLTQSENQRKKKSKGYVKYNKKFKAQIGIGSKKIYLGVFEKEEDARKAYVDAKLKYHNVMI